MLLRHAAASLLLAVAAAGAEPVPARVIERYKQMLAANPAEGTALDRLWKAYADAGETTRLMEEYRAGGTFASEMILGHLLRRAGQPKAAAEAFGRASRLDPKSPLPHRALATWHTEAGAPRAAAEAWEKAAALLPENSPTHADALLALGTAWIAAGEPERAAEAWEGTVALNPANLDLRRRLAESYMQHRQPARAVAHLEYLVAHAPPAECAGALQTLGRIHAAAGRVDDAAAALERAIALTSPGNWLRGELQGQLIRLHQRFGRVAELEEKWKKFAVDNPRDLGAQLQLVELYERLGDTEEQRAALEKLVALAPKNTAYRWKLARLLTDADQTEAAIAAYEALLAEQPANADWVFERARLDVRREAPDAAHRRIAALLAARKDDASLRGKALEFYQTHRLWDLAEAHLVTDASGGAPEAIQALANFYFSQKRDADGERTLRRVVEPAAPAAQQAAAWMQVAQGLKGQGMLASALSAVAEAEKLTPTDSPAARELAMLHGDLHAALAEPEKAQGAWELAAQRSQTTGQLAEVDQKLYHLLSQPAGEEKGGAGRAGGRIQFTLPRPPGEPGVLTPALERFLAALAAEAGRASGERGWLRLAQWHLWTRNTKAARDAAEQALAVAPDSVAAHDFLARLAAGDTLLPIAQRHLARLAELDPARRADYVRRSAQVELQAGRAPQAVAALETLAQAHPGDVEILTDLALARERAGRWDAALAAWREVHALSPASRKKESFAGMLRALTHTAESSLPPAELMLAELDARRDPKEQAQLFSELLAHCERHGWVPWLRKQWEARRARAGDDPATELAYARILRSHGRPAEAFEVLRIASFSVANPVEVLPDLVREAEELRRLDAAIEMQERLAQLSPSDQPEPLERLADLQEKNFAPAAAARTWDRIIARFSRDPAALGRAAEFLLRSGEPTRAAKVLRKVCALEPANTRALWTLAQLDLESDDARDDEEAVQCLEKILATAPAPADEAIRFPGLKPEDAGKLQSAYLATVRDRRGRASAEAMRALRSFWVELPAEGNPERDLRLHAIRELARLVRETDDPAALAAWVERWKARANAAPSEALWAWFYAGRAAETLDLVERLMTREPRNVQLQQAFIWLALQLREYARLGAWVHDRRRTPAERDFLLIALGQDLTASSGRVDPALLDGVFPPGARLRAWQAATLYGGRGQFREALSLAERALDRAGSARAGMRAEMATWQLCLGDREEALRLLRLACSEPAESFSSSAFAALRQAWLLAPAEERAPFAERVEREVSGPDIPPVHAALTRVLLRGLANDETGARAALRELLALQAMTAESEEDEDAPTRCWDFTLTTGMHLQTWRLHRVATAWWEMALKDPALVQLQGESAGEFAREVRKRFFALRVAYAAPEAIDSLLLEFRGASPSPDTVLALGEALENLGAHPRAIEVYRRVWERTPTHGQALRELLSACREVDDTATAEAALRVVVRDRLFTLNETVQRDLTLQLVDMLERRGDANGAIAVLAEVCQSAPDDTRLLMRLAQLQERAERTAEAEAAWRRVLAIEPSHVSARLGVAAVLEKAGRLPDAITALRGSGGTEIDARLAALHYQAGQTDEALAALERIPAPARLAAAQAVAKAMAERGERRLALGVLRDAAARAGADLAAAMRVQSQLLETLSPNEDARLIPQELRKLRRMAGDDPARIGIYFSFLQLHARTLSIDEAAAAELRAAWADGSGALPAGAVLLAWQLDRGAGAEAEATLDRFLTRADAGEAWLNAVVSTLNTARRPDLAARVQARLVEINPLDDERVLALVRTLAGCGRRHEALAAAEKWGARARINDDFAAALAQTLVMIGASDRAEPLFLQAVGGDPLVRNYRAYLDFAQLRLAQGNLRAARELLLAAFRHPGNREYDTLVAYLSAAGALDRWQQALAEFRFSPAQMTEVERARTEYLARSARNRES